jgi:K(+)-stimulated pyrophosphate-energized sodium pump
VSVRANIRTAAASKRCYNDSIRIAFYGGYFGAIINISLALLGIGFLFVLCYAYLTFKLEEGTLYDNHEEIPILLVGFGFGASFVAMFA